MYMKRILFAVFFICCVISCSKDESNPLDGTSWISIDNPTERVSFSNHEVFFFNNGSTYSADYSLKGDSVLLNNEKGLVIPDSGGSMLVIMQGILNGEAFELSFSCEERKEGSVIKTFSLVYMRAVFTATNM